MPSNTKRVKGVSIYRPIIYGSIATPVNPEKKPANMPVDHTHQWTISVKGVNDADITYFIKKVQFKLHADTYANPTRTIETPPFEVTESGWGEFEIGIKLFFHPESNEKPVTLFHYLKLHPYNGDEAELELARTQRRPVLSYLYDEVVFNEPTESMYEILTTKGTARIPARGRTNTEPFVEETEQIELDRLSQGLKTVQEQIKIAKARLVEKERQVVEMKQALEK
ncbi:yeats family-domain-containing protein [Geopyxis carbonaria]|nr:yeats family-domain-containing protein [Geopyxis carbonaria]